MVPVVKELLPIAAATMGLASVAYAQDYIIQPSQRPAYVAPGSGGSAVLQTPGRPPTYMIPRGNGSYVIPGQTPTYVTPRGNGTYTIQTPGHPPGYLTPTSPR
jgi:hypothetical protein